MNPRAPYRVETARLVLRCLELTDTPPLKAAIDRSLERLRPWLPWAAFEPEPLDDKVERVRGFRARFDLDDDHTYGVFDAGGRELLGMTGLHQRGEPRSREIGYWIATGHEGHGYVTEAVGALVRVAFELLCATRVQISCATENARSSAVPRRLGFEQEARLRQRLETADGLSGDQLVFSLFADGFAGSPAAAVAAAIRAYGPLGDTLLP